MIGYPIDSVVSFNDNGMPEYDRAISSAPLRELIKRLLSDGIPFGGGDNLRVQFVGSTRVAGDIEGATTTYNVVVNPGFGICGGCLKLQEIFYGLEMSVASATNPRIDTVVLRLNNNFDVRSCTFDIVQGMEALYPVAPALTRNSAVWEIGLADIYKPAVISELNPITVTDTRLDPERCGVISSIGEFDVSTLYDQIGVLSQLLTINKDNLVNAINEVFISSIPRTPIRNISVASSQALVVNPIPTSWQQVEAGTKYQSGGYVATASGYASGYEAYKAFDEVSTTSWKTPAGTQHTLVLELPEAILIDKVFLQFSSQGAANVFVQSSDDGVTWTTEVEMVAATAYNTNVTLENAPYTKYLRVLVSASSSVTFTLQTFRISDYTVYTLNAAFVLSGLPTLVDRQTVLVQIDPSHSATGVVSNTLNGIPIRSILQAGKKYELTYYTTYYTAKEVG